MTYKRKPEDWIAWIVMYALVAPLTIMVGKPWLLQHLAIGSTLCGIMLIKSVFNGGVRTQ